MLPNSSINVRVIRSATARALSRSGHTWECSRSSRNPAVPTENLICDAAAVAHAVSWSRLRGQPPLGRDSDRPPRNGTAVIVVARYAMECHVGATPMLTASGCLCDAAVVTMMQPADLPDGDDRAVGGDGPRDRGVLRQPEVGARVLVVRLVMGEDSSQAGLVEHDDVVDTIAP